LGGAARGRPRGGDRRHRGARRGDGGDGGVIIAAGPASRGPPSARRHTLLAELLDRVGVLGEMREPHSAQHVRRFGELDIVVANDLDAIAPRIEEIEKWTGQWLDTRCGERAAHRLLVVDHESEMTAAVGRLGAALLQREELVAQIDERRGLALSAQLELEQTAVEGQRLLDVADLERDMVETDGARFACFRHGSLRQSPCASCGDVGAPANRAFTPTADTRANPAMFPPERIVCLTEETVETLYLLGEERRIVGVSGYAVRPARVRREKPRVSAFISADFDKVLALEPDLVLAFSDLQ